MGNSQPGRFLAELPIAPLVPAAPFIQVGLLNAATARAEHMMGEDEFVFGFALFERPLEPMVLRVAERDSPPVAILVSVMALLAVIAPLKPVVHQGGRVPVVVQDHEERVAPRPGIIVLQRPNGFQRLGVAGVKAIGSGHGKIAVAGILGPDRDIMANVGLVEIEQRRLFVISVDQKERCGLGDQSQEGALEGVALGNRVRIDRPERVHAEIVAHADIEIGFARMPR